MNDQKKYIAEAQKRARESYSKDLVRSTKLLTQKARLENVRELAQRELSVNESAFEHNKHLLALNNGVYDLVTGAFTDHCPDNMLKSKLPYDYNPEKTCPFILELLKVYTMEDDEYLEYLQCLFGYCLTTSTDEQKVYFLFGDGANGKSTFVHILDALLSDDNVLQMSANTLIQGAAYGTSKDSDLMRLKGKRVAVSDEVPKNKEIDAGLVKRISGGDKVTARALYRGHETYEPMAKLFIMGNHRLKLEDSHAMNRRVCVLPFDAKIPEQGRIKKFILINRILEERSGLFNWAVEGLKKYQKFGMPKCAKVQDGTYNYINHEDSVCKFMNSNKLPKESKVKGSELHDLYISYCKSHGINSVNLKNFYSRLEQFSCSVSIGHAGYTYVEFK